VKLAQRQRTSRRLTLQRERTPYSQCFVSTLIDVSDQGAGHRKVGRLICISSTMHDLI